MNVNKIKLLVVLILLKCEGKWHPTHLTPEDHDILDGIGLKYWKLVYCRQGIQHCVTY